MPKIELTPAQRSALRSDAHFLNPVVIIGASGLTHGVRREVDAALNAHGLIKVRVAGEERDVREEIFHALCDDLNAAPIQHIGKLLVIWRPQSEKSGQDNHGAKKENRGAAPKDVKVLKFTRAGQKPEVRQVRVLGNQRLTAGGLVKKAKKASPRSLKKGPNMGGV